MSTRSMPNKLSVVDFFFGPHPAFAEEVRGKMARQGRTLDAPRCKGLTQAWQLLRDQQSLTRFQGLKWVKVEQCH
jgi:hypothetical protein